ncbi:exonuclease [Arthrobacter phage Abba]|uniref:Exonuclease n=1 Tax=Arthrobacter phage Abba TaxID=2713256 RepID=A0A6G8R2E5_9CAUD|nr:RecE-like recombination exonuclease [Arthrobacter phage Abba]QIN94364.1 exonuclease [Arthrobacter phage Abba]
MAANYSCPGSSLILPAAAPLEEWLATRREGIGGSDVSAIMGLNKWKSAYGVWLDKLGLSDPVRENAAMRWGKLHEPAMRQAFSEDMGLRVRSAGLHRSKSHPWMQVTVDGLVEDGGVFESKTLGHWTAEEWDDEQVSDHAELQVQHGMFVTGRSHAWVVGLIDGRDFRIRRVERNDELIDLIVERERVFWHEHVIAKSSPPVTATSLDEVKEQFNPADGSNRELAEADAAKLRRLWAELDVVKADEKTAKAEQDRLQAEIRLVIGTAETVSYDGAQLFNLRNNGTFSKTKFEADHPDEYLKHFVKKEVFDPKSLEAASPELYAQYRARVLRAAPKPKTPKAGK